jgi:hypothetical protein
MAAEVEPPELARLLDVAERPRVEQWSLRAALTRYAQPEPLRASAIIELVRRIEGTLRPHAKRFERDGVAVWAAVQDGATTDPADDVLVGVLRALVALDRLGDELATWAVKRSDARPDAVVDQAVAEVTRRLESLGVEREERRPGPMRRG